MLVGRTFWGHKHQNQYQADMLIITYRRAVVLQLVSMHCNQFMESLNEVYAHIPIKYLLLQIANH